ncbi:hypothetical protein ITG10_00945 [Vibrio sp. ED004]|uniref:hypothetical protein n=1 Tax=unclassified Vibrio TaxID=2614977 RepID=UPI0013E8CDF5|nr:MULTISPECIES: hypothetical protein [unclassified Vibrio]UPR56968.1 hypothetical protein ITG10_00945 [Vibrio sp. ED004]
MLEDVGPDSISVQFSLLENEDSGTVSVELIEDGNVLEVVGNIDFVKLNDQAPCLDNGVQIKSAYFNADYRGIGLGCTAYELIAKHHLLVSDEIQTRDGSALWKFKLGDHDELEINIIIRPANGDPFTMCDSDDHPIVYNYTKEELEPKIWGLERPDDESHPSIDASRDFNRENVVLVAIRRS